MIANSENHSVVDHLTIRVLLTCAPRTHVLAGLHLLTISVLSLQIHWQIRTSVRSVFRWRRQEL